MTSGRRDPDIYPEHLAQALIKFPDEATAVAWFEAIRWKKTGRVCPRCRSDRTKPTPSGKPMKYRCAACKCYFSALKGTPLQYTKTPLRTWAIAICLCRNPAAHVTPASLSRALDSMMYQTAMSLLRRLPRLVRGDLPGLAPGLTRDAA